MDDITVFTGTGAVVTEDIKDMDVVVGNPAKSVKRVK